MKKYFYILFLFCALFSQAQVNYSPPQVVPNRPASGAGRTYVTASVTTQTATATVYTVTNGKTLWVTSIMTDFYNTSLANNGSLLLQDNNTVLVPMLVPNAVAGQNQPQNGGDFEIFPHPLKFTTNVKMVIGSGTIFYSFSFTGYEE